MQILRFHSVLLPLFCNLTLGGVSYPIVHMNFILPPTSRGIEWRGRSDRISRAFWRQYIENLLTDDHSGRLNSPLLWNSRLVIDTLNCTKQNTEVNIVRLAASYRVQAIRLALCDSVLAFATCTSWVLARSKNVDSALRRNFLREWKAEWMGLSAGAWERFYTMQRALHAASIPLYPLPIRQVNLKQWHSYRLFDVGTRNARGERLSMWLESASVVVLQTETGGWLGELVSPRAGVRGRFLPGHIFRAVSGWVKAV